MWERRDQGGKETNVARVVLAEERGGEGGREGQGQGGEEKG